MEYSCADATLLYLLEVLLPYARQKLNLIDIEAHPGAYGILGASFGGLMALYTLLRLPKVFGRGLCQAGGYAIKGFDFPVWDLLENIRGTDVRIWMDCGRFDWLIQTNRRMAAALSDLVIPFHFHETNAGHNFPAWRDCLPHGLEFLFPAYAELDGHN
jgi:enterochelin esterase family protein